MPVWLVQDYNGRSLLLLTAADLATAQTFAGRFLPTADANTIQGAGLNVAQQADQLQRCRMAPLTAA